MGFYRLRSDWFAWSVKRRLSPAARILWLTLVGSRHADLTGMPGLWLGGIGTLSEESGLGPQDLTDGLAELEKAHLVVRDTHHGMILLTEFPDRSLAPGNGKWLKGIFRKWDSKLPHCQIRDLYPQILAWLISPASKSQIEAWSETFGPSTRIDLVATTADLAACGQPVINLWGTPQQSLPFTALSTAEYSYPQIPVSKMEKQTIPDSPDTGIDTGRSTIYHLPSGGEEISSARASDEPNPSPLPKPTTPDADRLGGLELANQHAARRRQLHPAGRLPPALVPADLLDTLKASAGRRMSLALYDRRLTPQLMALCHELGDLGITETDIRLAGQYLAAGALAYRDDLDVKWVATTGNLIGVIAKAREWDTDGRPPIGQRTRGSMTVHESVELAREEDDDESFTSPLWAKQTKGPLQ